jgi:hypothetical protein
MTGPRNNLTVAEPFLSILDASLMMGWTNGAGRPTIKAVSDSPIFSKTPFSSSLGRRGHRDTTGSRRLLVVIQDQNGDSMYSLGLPHDRPCALQLSCPNHTDAYFFSPLRSVTESKYVVVDIGQAC